MIDTNAVRALADRCGQAELMPVVEASERMLRQCAADIDALRVENAERRAWQEQAVLLCAQR